MLKVRVEGYQYSCARAECLRVVFLSYYTEKKKMVLFEIITKSLKLRNGQLGFI